ncbi:MAG: CD1247 N-terminal domain-containing protein [Clostridia bacterium]|jgi:rubrerythrin
MGYLLERVSYLKGLADGMNISSDTSEGRLLREIIEVLDDIAMTVEELEDDFATTADDLEDRTEFLESVLFDDDEDEDYFDYDDEDIDTIVCPACKGIITFSEDQVNEDFTVFTCPACGEEIELELYDDDECCMCDICGDYDDEDDEELDD